MSELIMMWVSAILLWVLVVFQIIDYKKRKATLTEIQKLIALIKGEK